MIMQGAKVHYPCKFVSHYILVLLCIEYWQLIVNIKPMLVLDLYLVTVSIVQTVSFVDYA